MQQMLALPAYVTSRYQVVIILLYPGFHGGHHPLYCLQLLRTYLGIGEPLLKFQKANAG